MSLRGGKCGIRTCDIPHARYRTYHAPHVYVKWLHEDVNSSAADGYLELQFIQLLLIHKSTYFIRWEILHVGGIPEAENCVWIVEAKKINNRLFFIKPVEIKGSFCCQINYCWYLQER